MNSQPHRQRRRSSSGGDGPVVVEIPIPVCITLYHLFPHPEGSVVVHHTDEQNAKSHQSTSTTSAAAATQASPTNLPVTSQPRWYRLPDHSKQLLRHSVKLEILDAEDNILYSSVHPGGAIHPSWDLLNERFQWLGTAKKDENVENPASKNDEKDAKSIWKGTYRSLTVRIRLLSGCDEKDSGMQQQQQVVLAEAPLYPTMLQRLITKSSTSVDSSRRSNDNNMSSSPQHLLPVPMPPNSLVVFFSDGSTRVPLPLFQFLVDHRVLDERSGTTATSSKTKSSMIVNEVEDFDRFTDDVFATLDQVKMSPTSNIATSSPPNVRKPRLDVSLIETEEEDHLHDSQAVDGALNEPTACPQLVGEDDEIVALPPFSKSEQEIQIEDLRQEQLELQRLLEEEEQAWKDEVQKLQEYKAELERLVSHSQSIQSETCKICDATQNEITSCQQAEFTVEALRIKLICELRTLYPIEVKSDQRYLIRGLELPRDVHSAVVSEDEVSAAFGFVSHLVGMMSKYLAVPLRYRLYCSSSRSAISLDGAAVFPLFSSRAVERDELDRALQLLHRNVDCLLQSRNIQCSPQTHVLAKLQRIYDKIIDGC